MKTIVAIGGGSVSKGETQAIDEYILSLTTKKTPNVLFVPTASGNAAEYVEGFEKAYTALGANVDSLLLPDEKSHINAKLEKADIVYVGGGNTLAMLKIWKETGFDSSLKLAYEGGTIMSGLSAGANCWFEYANSDSNKFADENAELIRIACLGWQPLLFCPHFNTEKDRAPSMEHMITYTSQPAFAMDNCAALVIRDDNWHVITSSPSAKGFRIFAENEEIQVRDVTHYSGKISQL